MSDHTIEPSRPPLDGFTVYEWGVYPRYSVMAGQTRKSFKGHFDTFEQAKQAYPKLSATYAVRTIPSITYPVLTIRNREGLGLMTDTSIWGRINESPTKSLRD